MRYRFTSASNLEDFASGRVLRSAPGLAAFPVRIGSELFQQARADLGDRDDLVVLDPVAGAANLLTAVGLLHGVVIRELIAVDVDPIVAGIVEANLSLVGQAGLRSRLRELDALHEQFHKESHAGAARSARNLLRLIEHRPRSPDTRVVVADSLDASGLRRAVGPAAIDISVADVPHGSLAHWTNTTPEAEGLPPLHRLLIALAQVTVKDGVAVIASPKTENVDAPETWGATSNKRYRTPTTPLLPETVRSQAETTPPKIPSREIAARLYLRGDDVHGAVGDR